MSVCDGLQFGERRLAADICSENPGSAASKRHSVKEHVGGRAGIPRKELLSQPRLEATYPKVIFHLRYTVERQDLAERYRMVAISRKRRSSAYGDAAGAIALMSALSALALETLR